MPNAPSETLWGGLRGPCRPPFGVVRITECARMSTVAGTLATGQRRSIRFLCEKRPTSPQGA
eukprot:14545979-Alexandrium_andersonii.AAC.1